MAWSPAFLDYIAGDRGAEVWRARVMKSWRDPGVTDYTIASCEGYGEALIAAPPKVSGARLTPVSWSSTIGTCTLRLHGSCDTLRTMATRGTVMVVELGRRAGGKVVWETVYWGGVWSLTGAAQGYDLELRDPVSVLAGRMDSSSPALFASTSSTTLQVDVNAAADPEGADTTGWLWDEDGDGIGCIRIDDELITFTTIAADVFDGTVTRGAFGTTAAAHTAGATITGVVLLRGHPLDIARRLILSHPESGNSVWDDYPHQWGLAVDQVLVDQQDISNWRATITPSSGSLTWSILHEDGAVEEGLAWLTAMLVRAGIFVTMRQGLLTVRGAAFPLSYVNYPPRVDRVRTITAHDLIEGIDALQTEAWAGEYDAEAIQVRVTTDAGSTSATSTSSSTLPAVLVADYDLTDVVRSNEAASRQEVLDRIALFATRVPEALLATGAGMHLAQLAPGDVVYLRHADAGIVLDYDESSGGRACYVTQVVADWAEHTVAVRLLAYPATEDAMPS